jgi:streptogramin lyase
MTRYYARSQDDGCISSLGTPWRLKARSLCLAVLMLCAPLSRAQSTINILEYSGILGPGDITAGPDGAMWFTSHQNIGRIAPTGVINLYPVPDQSKSPIRITAGPDGALWFTEGYPDAIGRITTSGTITEYPVPNPVGIIRGITTGPDGALWYTQWAGGKIGRITTDGVVTEYPLPHPASTDWITRGPDGAAWFTEANVDFGPVGRITPAGVITEFHLPPPVGDWVAYGSTGITTGPDGALWITEWAGHRILRLTTTGTVTEYDLGGLCPMTPEAWVCADGITAGPDGALWFTLFSANSIGRITTAGAVTTYPIPSPNSQSSGIATGPDGSIWFTEGAAGKIGRIVLTPPDKKPPVVTLLASPGLLWPPTGQLVPVAISGRIFDSDSGLAPSSLEYAVGDEYHLVQPAGQFMVDASGNFRFTVLLRASRDGNDKDGRHYTILVSARDNAGNQAAKWANVVVPHDRR